LAPAAEDVVSAYRWLLDQGIEALHVAFTGDSAGGGMVVTAMLLARDRGLPLPAAGMPLSPWFDYEATGESQQTNADTDKLLNAEFVRQLTAMFLGESGDPHEPYVNPLYGELAGLPPLFLQVSDAETSSTTVARSPSGLRLPASTCASTSSPASSTRFRWRPAGHPSPTTRSGAWPLGSVHTWACERGQGRPRRTQVRIHNQWLSINNVNRLVVARGRSSVAPSLQADAEETRCEQTETQCRSHRGQELGRPRRRSVGRSTTGSRCSSASG
jgi:hypothetical protein